MKQHWNVLSIDWDYFLPVFPYDPQLWAFYDWGHRDGGEFFLNEVWYSRAAGFKRNNMPLPQTTGLEKSFWQRFKYAPDCKLFIAESHKDICVPEIFQVDNPFCPKRRLFHFDAHHDGGYTGCKDRRKEIQRVVDAMRVTCDDWAIALRHMMGAEINMFYPAWKKWGMKKEPKPVAVMNRKVDNGEPISVPMDAVFICRSGGWTPPWLDNQFDEFVKACPAGAPTVVGDEPVNRNWDESAADEHMKQTQQAMEMFEEVRRANREAQANG